MGRNGKNKPVFTKFTTFVNSHVGETVTSNEVLLGKEPGRNSETAYLYKVLKLGYIEAVDDGFVTSTETQYRIVKPFPPHYNSVSLTRELREANGLIP